MESSRLITAIVLAIALQGGAAAHAADKVLQPGDNIRISVTRGRTVEDVDGGSIGEKLAAFEPVVKIQNGSFNDFKTNRVCLVMMGEDTTRKDNWKVIYRREFDADLLASKTFEWVGEPFEQGFDRTLAKSGYDYEGYIVLIRNAEGKIAISAQSKTLWTKDLERAWNLKEGQEYSKSFFR